MMESRLNKGMTMLCAGTVHWIRREAMLRLDLWLPLPILKCEDTFYSSNVILELPIELPLP